MHDFFESAVLIVELAAVALLLVGLATSTGRYLFAVMQKKAETGFAEFRRDLGRTLLLTLEFMIAADILETIAVESTLESLAILAGLVVIRTFLSLPFCISFKCPK